MKQSIEPGLLRIFRYFTGVATVYFALLWLYAIITTGWGGALQLQFWAGFAVYLGLEGYLSWKKLSARLGRFYLPLGLLISTVVPVFNNLTYLLTPGQANVELIISRSWLWLPVLLVPLVLIAWQYNLTAVVGFTIFANGLELAVLLAVVERFDAQTITTLGVPLIRAFAFGIVGYIVTWLMDIQRQQRANLMHANLRLSRYASTLDELATSRERNRLASELHDTLAHTLSGLAVNLEAIDTILNPAEAEAHAMLDHSLRATRVGLDETRRALKALRARPLEDLGLRLALDKLTQAAAERVGIGVSFACPESLPGLPAEVEQCVYRIAQEGLENMVRHAGASRAGLQVETPGGGLSLTLTDDGVGFNAAAEPAEDRFGLRSLRERAAACGGRLSIESQPGRGTCIRFVWEQGHD